MNNDVPPDWKPARLQASWILLFAVFVVLASSVRAAAPRVLIIDSFGRDIAPFNAAVSSFRTTLAEELGEPVDIYEASLDAARFVQPDMESAFAEFLRARFRAQPLELVVSVGAPAARFIAAHRSALFPEAPVLYMGVDPRMLPPGLPGTNATIVTQRVQLPGMIEDILQLKPDTTNIAVIFGDSPLEKFWVNECRREFKAFTNRISFSWLNDLSLQQIQKEVAALRPGSFILFGMMVLDAGGVPYDNDEALHRIIASAGAPVFGYFAGQFGNGAIGGRLYQDAEIGRCGAQTAIRILRGERPGSIAPQILESSVPTYDWRQLQRWGIPESNLPPGSIVRFRQPDFWQLYRGRILGLAAVCLLQTALIVGLFVQRKQNERQQHDFNRLLLAAHEAERARLARELHDDITQRMARLAIDLGRAGSPATDQTRSQIREELIRLSDDVHALSYQLHPSILEDLGLEEALRTDVDHFTRREGIPVELRLDKVAPGLPPATALGLYRIAQEALRNVARHARASEVRVNLESAAGELRLTIGDNGAGFDPARQSGRPSLGLAGMKERASLLGGRIEIDSRPGKGTIVAVSVPLNGD